MPIKWSNNWYENLQNWLDCPYVPAELREPECFPYNVGGNIDLRNETSIHANTNLYQYLTEAFAEPLNFGTAGLRGKMGPGINRINIYTIATATQGVATWLLNKFGISRCNESCVVIGYDGRNNSQLFAEVAACVLAANGIHVDLFPSYCPTPLLAYAIRPLEAIAGIMITASHNAASFNGYKLYAEDGIQVGQEDIDIIAGDISSEYMAVDFDQAVQNQFITYVPQTIDHDYIEKTIHLLSPAPYPENITLAYSAMHGTGAKIVLPLLRIGGFKNIKVVKEQIDPNGDFPTVESPNPEITDATAKLLELARNEKVDLACATDPDADRLAVIIPDRNGEYHQLTGNQTAVLLMKYWLDYLKHEDKLQPEDCVVKSIVTADLAKHIAKAYNIHLEEALTGFKDICGKIREFAINDTYNYIMGFEESIGYALGQNVLDKDGCSATFIFANAAAYYKNQNLSLWDVLDGIFQDFGYLAENTINLVREGQRGQALIQYIISFFRMKAPTTLADTELDYFEDYLSSYRGKIHSDGQTRRIEHCDKLLFRSANVIRFHFNDESWYAIRPSGTEPKLKLYIYAIKPTKAEAETHVAHMYSELNEILTDLENKFQKNQLKE